MRLPSHAQHQRGLNREQVRGPCACPDANTASMPSCYPLNIRLQGQHVVCVNLISALSDAVAVMHCPPTAHFVWEVKLFYLLFRTCRPKSANAVERPRADVLPNGMVALPEDLSLDAPVSSRLPAPSTAPLQSPSQIAPFGFGQGQGMFPGGLFPGGPNSNGNMWQQPPPPPRWVSALSYATACKERWEGWLGQPHDF